MKINRKLNLVVPIEGEDGRPVAYIHSQPLSTEAIQASWAVLGRTHAAITQLGLGQSSGPRFASFALQGVAEQLNAVDEIKSGLRLEILRLSSLIAPGKNGWETHTLDFAIKRQMLDKDLLEEAEGVIIFFIVVSAGSKLSHIPGILKDPSRSWGFQTTSHSVTEFLASLPTSTTEDNFGEKMPELSETPSTGSQEKGLRNGAPASTSNANRPKSSEVVTSLMQ